MIESRFRFFKHIPLLPHIIDEQLKLYTLFFKPKVFRQMMDYVNTVKKWDQVTVKYHRYGGLEFQVNGIEIGHIHGNGLIDLHFNKAISATIIQKQLAEPHHVLKETGWISFYLANNTQLPTIIQLTQLSYELKRKSKSSNELINAIQNMPV